MIATLSTGAARTVTAQSAFASDAPSVVSVSGSGKSTLLAGEAAGTAQITASFGGSASAPASASASASASAPATASMPLTADSISRATVASLAMYNVPGVLHLPHNATASSALRALLDDGTVYSALHYLHPTTHYSLYSPLTTHHSPLTTHHSPLTIHWQVYSSLHELSWLEASSVVQYSSDTPSAVAIDPAGTPTQPSTQPQSQP